MGMALSGYGSDGDSGANGSGPQHDFLDLQLLLFLSWLLLVVTFVAMRTATTMKTMNIVIFFHFYFLSMIKWCVEIDRLQEELLLWGSSQVGLELQGGEEHQEELQTVQGWSTSSDMMK